MFHEQLGLFTHATGLPFRPKFQIRSLEDVALEVLVLTLRLDSQLDLGQFSRLVSRSPSYRVCQAEDQPWNLSIEYMGLAVSVYDLEGEHRENSREAYKVDKEFMGLAETEEAGHVFFGSGLLNDRYGFIISVSSDHVKEHLSNK